ncbi:hypothetical protein H0H92_011436 [Tricholoma furcatifolium]|nr:hypothetical protein H0H92_011436 [Tricholoma furcatifolium]
MSPTIANEVHHLHRFDGPEVYRDVGPSSPETPRSRRHGAPAGPWPWQDFSNIQPEPFSTDVESPTVATPEAHNEWRNYPQSLFPNWTKLQVHHSKIADAILDAPPECTVHFADIRNNAPFSSGEAVVRRGGENHFSEIVQAPRPADVAVRALFLGRPSGSVLQILGTK